MNKYGLPEDVFSEILGVLRRYPEIECAKIFGSRAKGNYKRYSDIDIAIYAGSSAFVKNIKQDLDDLYVIYNFDVVDYNMLSNVELKAHIDRVGIVINENPRPV